MLPGDAGGIGAGAAAGAGGFIGLPLVGRIDPPGGDDGGWGAPTGPGAGGSDAGLEPGIAGMALAGPLGEGGTPPMLPGRAGGVPGAPGGGGGGGGTAPFCGIGAPDGAIPLPDGPSHFESPNASIGRPMNDNRKSIKNPNAPL